jgi:uncharacterized radical SAM superfamily protein
MEAGHVCSDVARRFLERLLPMMEKKVRQLRFCGVEVAGKGHRYVLLSTGSTAAPAFTGGKRNHVCT